MKKEIASILREATNGTVDETVLSEIEKVFNSKVNARAQIHVEKALTEQDALYTKKLEQLLEAIDIDHTKKLNKVIKAFDSDRTRKLKTVVERYERTINRDAKGFQKRLVESISNYLELYLNKVIPSKQIKEAVKNRKAMTVLEGIRKHLAVDSALQKDSIKAAVIDGKRKINEASKKLESVLTENAAMKKELNKVRANLILEQRTAKLDKRSASYIKKVLSDKTPQFINENFDYTLNLFKQKEENRLENLRDEALQSSSRVDRVIEERFVPTNATREEETLSPYLSELSKY